MRKLTEKGFLEKYLQSLSLNNTSSINKLMKELPDNPRIIVPLAYYAYIMDLPEKTIKKNQILSQEVDAIRLGKRLHEIKKLKHTYEYASGRKNREDNLKRLMHKKLLLIMSEKGITNYRLYKSLGLDPSNTNSFIKNCNCDRVNIDTVRLMIKYAEEFVS